METILKTYGTKLMFGKGIFCKKDIISEASKISEIEQGLCLNDNVKVINVTVNDIIENFRGDIFLVTKKSKILNIDDFDCFSENDNTLYSVVYHDGKMIEANIEGLSLSDKLNFIVQSEWPFREPELKAIENPENEYQEYINSLI